MNHIEDGIVAAADAQSLGGIVAENYALKTDVAPDSTMLGGKAPEYYLQPRNLLDNSDFRNPVNQRGAVSGDYSWGYAIDRWMLNGSGFVIDENGITIPAGGRLVQRQAPGVVAENDVKTLAVKLADGSVFTSTSATQYGDLYLSKGSTDKYSSLNIENKGSGTITVQWAALYEGAYTADTLPPYVPKGYAAEMAECLRYYNIIPYDMDDYYVNTNTEFPTIYPVSFPEMRIIPTVTLKENWNTGSAGISVGYRTKSSLGLQVAATNSRVAWHGKIELNADL